MRLGIAGNGKIVQEFCSIKDTLSLSVLSICGRQESQQKIYELKEKYGLERCFFDYTEFLEDEIDTVYVAVINSLHYEYAKKALEHGKNVIIEKPFALRYAEASELYTLARENGLFIWEAMTIPYMPAYIHMRERLKENKKIKMAIFQYGQRSSRYDAFLQGEILPAFDPKLGGGALMDLNVYNIYAAIDLFGVPENAVYHGTLEKGVDVNGTLVMKYPDFQVVCIAAKDSASPCQSVIQCEDGTFVIEGPLNRMSSYDYVTIREQDTWTEKQPKHRMVYEFQTFQTLMQQGDMESCYERMEKSLEVMKILGQARETIR